MDLPLMFKLKWIWVCTRMSP